MGDIEFYMQGMRKGLGIRRESVLVEIDKIILMDPNDVASIVSYAGDLLDAVKKRVIYRKPLGLVTAVQSMAGMEAILQIYRVHNGVSWEEVLQHNFDKLEKKYEGHKYSDSAARKRVDKAEGKEETLTEMIARDIKENEE